MKRRNRPPKPIMRRRGGVAVQFAILGTVLFGFVALAVDVGGDANTQLMPEIADIGEGEHFHAEGFIEGYNAQLEEIFFKLGGKRPVMLIEIGAEPPREPITKTQDPPQRRGGVARLG